MENTEINKLIDNCWYDTTGLYIHATELDELSNNDELYIASIVFTGGDNQGSFTIAMGSDIARIIAGNMFQSTVEDLSDDDIRDSLGELANVLAGNLKSNFFGNSSLSKPMVLQGDDSLFSVFKIDAIFQKTFLTDKNQQLLIQVCKTS